MTAPLLQLHAITKRFGATTALAGVDLVVNEGEIHALIGENGAGKSTLMKIVSGAEQPDAGSIDFAGTSCRIPSPGHARRLGTAMIYQELTLAPHLSVAANILLGCERHRAGFLRRESAEIRQALEALGHGHLDPRTPVRALGMGERQVVEIARALVNKARLVILDEPTSSLSQEDTQRLFAVLRRLREGGVGITYISHFLDEVAQIADRFTVLRDGRSVACGDVAGVTIPHLIRHMVGRELAELFPRTPHAVGNEVLRVVSLSRPPDLVDASFSLREGEILGIAGLVGAGRTELLRAIFGLDAGLSGRIALMPRDVTTRRLSPSRALAAGVDLLSEDRKEEGLAVRMPVRDNVTLSSLSHFVGRGLWGSAGLIDTRRESDAVTAICAGLSVKLRNILQPVADLSGGNQQKVALARIAARGNRIILMDEPTRGIDVGSKVEIYRLIGAMAAEGKSIVVVSSYLPELFGICDTLAVMHRGRLSPARPVAAWTQEEAMAWAVSGGCSSA